MTTHVTDTQYLACHDCKRLQPLAVAARPDDDSVAAATEALLEFQAEHEGHSLAIVSRHDTAVRAIGPVWDPMSIVTFTVTDGHTRYLVTVERASVDEPRIYRFTPGHLESLPTSVSIEDAHLLHGLDRELYPHALRPSKLDSFIGVVRAVIESIDVDALDVAFDDADDPSISIARMPDAQYVELVQSCSRIFDATELPRVSDFLAANRSEDGLLALRVRHDYRIAA
ncbi:hypothetical protein L6Q96_12585 [Candidatus Binatia bacterium]|nr:hypothetical protein [Candidatus Binatia bacterium]